ncbi:MAG TPA: hypothetical protein VNK91_02015 [Burkholderiaceae bacterium]|nr:hypothetical protein [Burkholderiaceae bacterium]
MAALSIADRTRVWRALMRRWSNERTACAFLRAQLYDPAANTGAVAETDAWVDTHSGLTTPDTIGYNGALNVTMRAALSINQKTDLFLAVAAMRRGPDYVRSVFGEID